ncbi:MAG: sodium:proton antiporter, partial [Pseudomonadota bacterium]
MYSARSLLTCLFSAALLLMGTPAFASTGPINLTDSTVGGVALSIFVLAYLLVMSEEKIQLRKSKP